MSTRTIHTQTEPLGAVKARQVVWTEADRRATEGLTDDDLVLTYTEVTPFGRFLLAVTRPPIEQA